MVALSWWKVLFKSILVCMSIYGLENLVQRKIRIKFGNFQVPISQKLLRQFLSNLVCKVVHIIQVKYINLIEIDPIVLNLQWAEMG